MTNAILNRLIRIFLALSVSALIMAPAMASAQTGDKVTVNLTDPSRPATVKVSLIAGGIVVKGGPGKDVLVEAHVRGQESSRGEGGMKRIPMNTTGLEVEEENNRINVRCGPMQRPVDITVTVPRRTSLVLHTVNDGDISVIDVDGELEANDVNGNVSLKNIGGSAVVHAVNGQVLVTFNRVDPKPMAFSSLNGDIDVTFPPDIKATVNFQSDRGEVLSDFDVQLQSGPPKQITEDGRNHGGSYRVRIEKAVRGTINGGGPEIQFKNFNGNIYVRKAK